ncbi:MAG: TRAP transporter small permease [Clostridiales bacterium]|nr:TRAP transporter small permease [Clostridiales bacterium]
MKKALVWLWDHFDDALTFIMFMGLFLTVLFQLVMRVAFNGGFVWTEELSRLFLMYACFASLPRVLKKREELKLTMFIDRLDYRKKQIFDIVVQVISIVAFVFLVYWGVKTMEFQAGNIMPAMRFSMAWMYVAFPLSMAGGIIRAVQMIVEDLKNMKEEAKV